MRTACLVAVVVGLGCASKGAPEPTDEFLEADGHAEIAPAPVEPDSAARVRPTVLPDPSDDAWNSVHYNLTLQVEDPSAAVDHARTIFTKGGAEIQNANRRERDGSINVVTDRKTYAELLASLGDFDGTIVSENASQNDMGPQIRQLRERLDLARRADEQLADQAKRAHGQDLDAVMYLRELNYRERQNLDSQIRSYWDQAGKTYVYLNFQKPQ